MVRRVVGGRLLVRRGRGLAQGLDARHRPQRHFLQEHGEDERDDQYQSADQEHQIHRVGEPDAERMGQRLVDLADERRVVETAATADRFQLAGMRGGRGLERLGVARVGISAAVATLLLTVLTSPAAAFGSPDHPATAQPAVAPAGVEPPDSNVSVSGTAVIPSGGSSALDDPATAHPAVAPAGSESPDSNGSVSGSAVVPADYYCVFITRYDEVHHPAGTDYVSGHGWWDNVDCPAGTKAKVTTWIQEYYSDGSWRTKDTGDKTVYSGGGSANRSNARRTCQGSATVSWRSEVDVDLVGISDSNNIGRSPTVNLPCVVN